MRITVILVLALFAIASAEVEATLRTELHDGGNRCYADLRDFAYKVHTHLHERNSNDNILDELVTIAKWSNDLQPVIDSCKEYLTSPAGLASSIQRTDDQKDLSTFEVIESNAKRYHAYIISNIANGIDEGVNYGNGDKAAAYFAGVFKLLTGASRPEGLSEVNWSQVRNIRAQYPYYYIANIVVDVVKQLTNQETAQEVKGLSDALASAFLQFKQVYRMLMNTHNPTEEAVLLLDGFRVASQELNNVGVAAGPVATKLRQLQANKIGSTLKKVVNNVVVHLPTIEHELEEAVVDIYSEKPKEAAKRIVEVIKTAI